MYTFDPLILPVVEAPLKLNFWNLQQLFHCIGFNCFHIIKSFAFHKFVFKLREQKQDLVTCTSATYSTFSQVQGQKSCSSLSTDFSLFRMETLKNLYSAYCCISKCYLNKLMTMITVFQVMTV